MKAELALRVLGQIMQWDGDRAREEFAWLRLMARLKFDRYQGYLAGARFLESLADWLQQFEMPERETAYQFIRDHLVYIDAMQMQHLVELVYPETVQRQLTNAVAEQRAIPKYAIWANQEASDAYTRLLRRTLFVALSDGARIDVFRRVNAGVISNEQIVVAPQINSSKWRSLLRELRKELCDQRTTFAFVFLLDDFVGSGFTLLRDEDGDWMGKLRRFWDDAQDVIDTHFDPEWELYVHHYVATHIASQRLPQLHQAAALVRAKLGWFKRVTFTFGTVLPPDLAIDRERHGEFMSLIDRYYNPAIETRHSALGGTDLRLGFQCGALPLVLEHNTPNNSLALLWADTSPSDGEPVMRPLFRRRQRHS